MSVETVENRVTKISFLFNTAGLVAANLSMIVAECGNIEYGNFLRKLAFYPMGLGTITCFLSEGPRILAWWRNYSLSDKVEEKQEEQLERGAISRIRFQNLLMALTNCAIALHFEGTIDRVIKFVGDQKY